MGTDLKTIISSLKGKIHHTPSGKSASIPVHRDWLVLFSLLSLLAFSAVIFGVYSLYRISYPSATPDIEEGIVSETFSRQKLDAAIDGFENRSRKFESLKARRPETPKL